MQKVTLIQAAQLIAVSITVAFGQILFKVGADSGPAGDSVLAIVRLTLQPVVIVALVLYGGAVVLWVVTLQQVPLSLAYPFMALGFVLTPLAGALVFNEPLDLRYCIGMGMIVGGIYLSTAPR